MSYTKNPTWQDGKAGGTLITAATLNHLEDGVAAAAATADSAQSGLSGKADTAHTHAAADVTDFAETVRDTMGTALVAGSNVTITVDDPGDTITIAASGGDGPPPGDVRPPVGWWVAPHALTGTKTGKTIASTRPSYIVVPAKMTVDQVGIQVTTAEAAMSAKLLVYAPDAGGLPATLVIDSGPLSLAAIGNVTATLGAPVVLPPGIYWGFLVTDGTTAQVEVASQDARQPVADTFNRVRNTLSEWWSASAGTYAAPAASISSFTWSSLGYGSNVSLIWAMRRSA